MRTIRCPACNSPVSFNKEWTIVCRNCERVISTRPEIYPPSHYLNGTNDELLQKFLDYIEINLSPEEWGFRKRTLLPNKLTVIYDSDACRVKFGLRGSDYGPLYATSIYYGRLHAPDNELNILWNGEQCRCWHSNSDILTLVLPFLEGMSPQQTAIEQAEFWQSREKSFGAYPSDEIEYPLNLHSKIWERYGGKLFSVFDLRQPELWEEYTKYSDEFNSAWQKRWSTSRGVEKIC